MKLTKMYWTGCLVACIFSQAFVACSDDDGNGPAFSKDGKRLVHSISYDWWEADGEKGMYYFKYDEEGRMTGIELRSTYFDDEDECTYTYAAYYTYSVSGNKLAAKYTCSDGEETEYEEGNFVLNKDGFVSEGELRNNFEGEKEVYSYRCFYDGDRQLIRTECPAHNGILEYHWEVGNYVRINDGISFSTYTYYDTENRCNIDFGSILSWEGLGDDDLLLGVAGYLGKMSRNLMKSEDFYRYSYEFDEEGYVTEITETDGDTRNTYIIKYN